jgi:hypothetical protein
LLCGFGTAAQEIQKPYTTIMSESGARAKSATENAEMRYANFSFLTSLAYGYFSYL